MTQKINNGGLRRLILGGFQNCPSLLDPRSADELVSILRNADATFVAGSGFELEAKKHMASMFFDDDEDEFIDYERSYLFADGIAYIPISGLLLNRVSFSGWGITGYDYVRTAFNQALAHDDVKGIVFDINSGGGQVHGNFELADYIKSRQEEKPMMGIINAVCCSGAYSLGSAIGNLTAVTSADVGSIGVYMMHVDQSKLLEDIGVKITFVYAGDRKVEGNFTEPLSDEARANMQKSVDASYDAFTSLVAENMGLKQQAVKDTQAGVFGADEALRIGLIHNVATPQEAIAAFKTELSGSTTTEGVASMTDKTKPGGENEAAIQQKAIADAASAAVQAFKERQKAITTHAEAEGREELAVTLANNEAITVEAAVEILKAAPKKAKAADPVKDPKKDESNFDKAMKKDNSHLESGDGGDEGDKAVKLTGKDRLIAAAKKANLERYRTPVNPN